MWLNVHLSEDVAQLSVLLVGRRNWLQHRL
jgi:hypothetical protein